MFPIRIALAKFLILDLPFCIDQVWAGQYPLWKELQTIEENERDLILGMLKYCNGRIGGYKGAAEFLGVPPSTLSSKLKRFAITKEHFLAV